MLWRKQVFIICPGARFLPFPLPLPGDSRDLTTPLSISLGVLGFDPLRGVRSLPVPGGVPPGTGKKSVSLVCCFFSGVLARSFVPDILVSVLLSACLFLSFFFVFSFFVFFSSFWSCFLLLFRCPCRELNLNPLQLLGSPTRPIFPVSSFKTGDLTLNKTTKARPLA